MNADSAFTVSLNEWVVYAQQSLSLFVCLTHTHSDTRTHSHKIVCCLVMLQFSPDSKIQSFCLQRSWRLIKTFSKVLPASVTSARRLIKKTNTQHTRMVFVDLVMGRLLRPKLDLLGCERCVEETGFAVGQSRSIQLMWLFQNNVGAKLLKFHLCTLQHWWKAQNFPTKKSVRLTWEILLPYWINHLQMFFPPL